MAFPTALATRYATEKAMKHWPYIVGGVVAFFVIIIAAMIDSIAGSGSSVPVSPLGIAKVPPSVERWKSTVYTIANREGIGQYTELFLALICQETGTSGDPDIMQSSEEAGLPPNSITDPVVSLQDGIQYFKSLLDYGKARKVDFDTVLQSYNFGKGYIDFVAQHGGKDSTSLSEQFSQMEASVHHVPSYGDPLYVQHVMRYMEPAKNANNAGNASASALGAGTYKTLMTEAEKYQGFPYVYGGSNPEQSFDCSGLTQYVYGNIGVPLPRTAQQQYDATQRISQADAKPGDLIFFAGTYNDPGNVVTHVGIYVGNGEMYDADNSGVGFHALSGYWMQHLYGFGRVYH